MVVSLEVFQEQFRSLQAVEEGKDQLIKVSCLDNLFPTEQTVLIDYFTDRTYLFESPSRNVALRRKSYILNVNRRPRSCTKRSSMMSRLSLGRWTRRSYESSEYCYIGPLYWLYAKDSNSFVSVLIDGDCMTVSKKSFYFGPLFWHSLKV